MSKKENAGKYCPKMKDWELFFYQEDGMENRTKVVKAFSKWLEDYSEDILEMPGITSIGGKVFGHKSFDDKTEIVSSVVKSVERIEAKLVNGVPHDLLCFHTQSGSKYYGYTDECNPYMFLMLGDMYHKGELSPRRNFYLGSKYRDSKKFI